jgi:hypothetical protein
MSFYAVALVLLAVVALANAACTPSLNGYVLQSPSQYNTIGAGGQASASCLPGYVMNDGSSSTSFTIYCSSTSLMTYSGSSTFSGYCTQRYDWCPLNVNANFGNTSTVSYYFSRTVGSNMRLLCKPTGLGRNWKGNGTSIQVYCDSLADGSGGVWVSDDWCSGAIGVSANLALLALAAVAGLLHKRSF